MYGPITYKRDHLKGYLKCHRRNHAGEENHPDYTREACEVLVRREIRAERILARINFRVLLHRSPWLKTLLQPLPGHEERYFGGPEGVVERLGSEDVGKLVDEFEALATLLDEILEKPPTADQIADSLNSTTLYNALVHGYERAVSAEPCVPPDSAEPG